MFWVHPNEIMVQCMYHEVLALGQKQEICDAAKVDRLNLYNVRCSRNDQRKRCVWIYAESTFIQQSIASLQAPSSNDVGSGMIVI